MQMWGGVVQRWGRNKHVNKIPDYGDLMTIHEFIDMCMCGAFINSDGFGNYSDGKFEYSDEIIPSYVQKRNNVKNYTHIVWYNK